MMGIWYNRGQQKTASRCATTQAPSIERYASVSSSIPPVSGIYKITCTANDKIYIGSSVNLKRRFQNHKTALSRGDHSNCHLQSAWGKYGADAFIFEVLEYISVESLLEREQYWLDQFRSYDRMIGFNIASFAEAPMRGRTSWNKGLKSTDETRAKLRVIVTGTKHSSETREKMRISQTGKKMKPESITRTAAAHEKQWIITTPDGEKFVIKNLSQFCKDNGLNRGNMISVARGKRNHNHGWKCQYDD